MKKEHILEINPYTLTIYQNIHNDEKLETVTLQWQKYGYVRLYSWEIVFLDSLYNFLSNKSYRSMKNAYDKY